MATLEPSTVAFLDDEGSRCGALSMNPSPPRLRLAVATVDGESKHVLLLGDTFVVRGRTWRFEDVVFHRSTSWIAELRYVPPGAPPYRPPAEPRDYVEVELRHFGTVDEAEIVRLEQDLGRRLPPMFRMWLAHSNGAAPVREVSIPGTPVTLGPAHPILGVHPDEVTRDIRFGQRQAGAQFSDLHVVIALGRSGSFAVGVAATNLDGIFMLREDVRVEIPYAEGGQRFVSPPLYQVASGIGEFCAALQPVPPATAVVR
ncbi:DUF6406 domain-containing protein [Dactylosporangium siamense]|uniref:DUF6406 domain-containing protein n=1 Tax=Dactylosporangium siamense TaxID=685454 RepID=UPI001944F653|nr:DUF6406 domain-containing protein [Dactylosporangium siamense]